MKGVRATTLKRGIAYRVQAKASSDLKPSLNKKLLKIAKGGAIVQQDTLAKPKLQIGTKLVREWNGRTFEVIVTDNGFEMNGGNYASLSAIAKTITGAHWSGPRFFGLRL